MKPGEDSRERAARVSRLLHGNDPNTLKRNVIAFLKDMDRDLGERVEANLADADKAPQSAPRAGVSLQAGDTVGAYRIERLLDRGGMGSVFLAVRNDDLDLKIALKTLDHWSPDIHDLFKSESKILSGLKHPGIAHLIDVGLLPDGRPWMAMEYVVGRPLDVYVLRNKLTLEARLKLFLDICDAVSYAHRQLILHRDIKPNNILVNERGTPKLLDFGIASMLNPDTGRELTVAVRGEGLLTPGYASPEQTRGERLTAASDVYSLGVILYELVTELSPYARHQNMPLLEAVRQAPIPRPSHARHPQSGATVGFGSALRGDLDTIVLKALERDMDRRYPSVEALSGDVRLYLAGQPITARPASLTYRIGKFVSRNPWPLSAGAVLVVLLLTFALFADRQRRAIAAERDQAENRRQTAESVTGFLVHLFEQVDPDENGGDVTAFEILESGRLQLEHNLGEQIEVRGKLSAAMGRVYHALGKPDEAYELLSRAAEFESAEPGQHVDYMMELVSALQDMVRLEEAETWLARLDEHCRGNPDPNLNARLQHLIGVQQTLRGHFDRADRAFQEAERLNGLTQIQHLDLLHDRSRLFSAWRRTNQAVAAKNAILAEQQRLFGGIHSKIAKTHLELAELFAEDAGFEVAEDHLDKAKAIYERLYEANHPAFAGLHRGWAHLRLRQGRYDEAVTFYERALAEATATLGEDHPRTIEYLHQLGQLYVETRDWGRAEALLQRGLEAAAARLGEDHPLYSDLLGDLGVALYQQEKLTEAEALFRRQGDSVRGHFGENHPQYATVNENLSLIFKQRGDLASALALQERALAIKQRSLGERHPQTAFSLNNMALLLRNQGDLDGAVAMMAQCAALRRDVLGEKHLLYAETLHNLGYLYRERGDLDLAETTTRQALDLTGEIQGETHPNYASTLGFLARILQLKGRLAEAEALYNRQVRIAADAHGEDHVEYGHAMYSLGYFLHQTEALERAEVCYRKALDIYGRVLGRKHQGYGSVHFRLANLLLSRGRWAEAVVHIEEALPILETHLHADHVRLHAARGVLGAVKTANGPDAEGEAMLRNAYAALKRLRGEDHRYTQITRERLIAYLERTGRRTEAATLEITE